MNYINIHSDDLRRPEYLLSEPIARATWLNLLSWCITQENGGVIKGAAKWGDRAWLQMCGVTKEETQIQTDLYHYDGEDLVIFSYPVDKEEEVKNGRDARRENGKLGGRPSQKTKEEPRNNLEETKIKPKHNLDVTNKEKGKGKEKGKEKGSEVECAGDETIPQMVEKIVSAYPKQSHHRDTREQIEAAIHRRANRASMDPLDAAEEILQKTAAIKAKLMDWPASERQQFAPSPPNFFQGDRWADDPEEWQSRINSTKNQSEDEKPNLGGRKGNDIYLTDEE